MAGVVFWDFDGTLAIRTDMWGGALLDALERVSPGHGLVRDDLRPGLRDGFPWHTPEVDHLHLADGDLWWASLDDRFVLAYTMAGLDESVAVEAGRLVRHTYCDPARHTVIDGAVEGIEALSAAGWRHVIVSNHVPELPALVAELGLADHIDHIICSAAVGYEKPPPQIFEIALERAGRPSEAWFVGDNPVADIEGATAAGIRAILVGGTSGRTLREATAKILASSD